METLDGATLSQQILRLGLVTEDQIKDVRDEAGTRTPDVQTLLRILERKTLLTPWQSGKLLKGDVDGYFLGGYRLLYRISAGSFGRVYRADDPATGRVVAVKVLRRRWSEDAHRIDLFAREAQVGLTLKHNNVVEILAMSQDPASKQYYIVMEFVEGQNLRELLQIRKTLPNSVALRIVDDAASGLAYAHSRGYTHRDVKPTNLLISSTGTTKLVDFGLAGITAGDDKDGRLDRTVDYAGLERATNVKNGDARSDIYFLGCVLFEMLVGKPPLAHTRDKNARMQRHRFDNLLHLQPGQVEGPPGLYLLVETMTTLLPQRRYQTAAQLLDAVKTLRREIDGPPAGTGGAGAMQRSLFVVERDERLQDALREKFKELGYRVLMAGDPLRALDRFRLQPFQGLVIDVGTTGEDGLLIFDQIMIEAQVKKLPCAGIVILSEEQANLVGRLKPRPQQAVLVRPVTMKQLQRKLAELMEVG